MEKFGNFIKIEESMKTSTVPLIKSMKTDNTVSQFEKLLKGFTMDIKKLFISKTITIDKSQEDRIVDIQVNIDMGTSLTVIIVFENSETKKQRKESLLSYFRNSVIVKNKYNLESEINTAKKYVLKFWKDYQTLVNRQADNITEIAKKTFPVGTVIKLPHEIPITVKSVQANVKYIDPLTDHQIDFVVSLHGITDKEHIWSLDTRDLEKVIFVEK